MTFTQNYDPLNSPLLSVPCTLVAELYGDVSGVLGLVVGIIALVFTILAWWNARSARRLAQTTVDTMSRHVLASDVSRAMRYVHEASDAAASRRWDRAIDRCRESRLVMLPLASDLRLLEDERASVRSAADNLRVVVRFIEQKRVPAGSATDLLGNYHTKFFDEAIDVLAQLEGRLRFEAAEVE